MTEQTLLNTIRLSLTTAAITLSPLVVAAAGSSNNTPPEPTETTIVCPEGTVYNEELEGCVRIESNLLDDDTLYGAVREFAYAGDYAAAARALDAMSDQQDDRVLTYRGFILRKTGDFDAAMVYYQQAIATNPDNLLVRSYMGQGLVTVGRRAEAREQLAEIRARGGAGSWPETALLAAVETGATSDY